MNLKCAITVLVFHAKTNCDLPVVQNGNESMGKKRYEQQEEKVQVGLMVHILFSFLFFFFYAIVLISMSDVIDLLFNKCCFIDS